MAASKLFESELKVVNIGLESFRQGLTDAGIKSVQAQFKPPLSADTALFARADRHAAKIKAANKKALARILAAKPALVGMGRALDVVPGMKKDLILHAGPPITWARMCGPMRGGIMAALMYEGMAENPKEAAELAASGRIKYSPCHEHSCVGPMAGIISASMPVFIIKNETAGNFSYGTQNEGLGKVLRYGAYSPDVIARLKWMETVLYPTLKAAIKLLGKIDLKSMVAQALHMGDEMHNRNRAGTSLFYRAIAPAVIKTARDPETAAKVLDFINGNDHFFLNLSMPLAKATLDAGRGIKDSSLVVVMARNGTDFGVQLSGTGGKWFTGAAPVPDALYFPGYTKADANPDLGDSTITETCGLGGFAIAAAPAIVQFVGGQAADAVNYTLTMYEITAGENNIYKIPYLNFRGTPTGIDAVKVARSGILPFLDTGVAHKKAGIGQIGAGVLSAPPEPFARAFEYFAKTL
jgi:hypothetical protein